MALKDSAAQSALSLGGKDPAPFNPNKFGPKGEVVLAQTGLDRDNGATPPRYLDNPPS
jgi:hypothetical protein